MIKNLLQGFMFCSLVAANVIEIAEARDNTVVRLPDIRLDAQSGIVSKDGGKSAIDTKIIADSKMLTKTTNASTKTVDVAPQNSQSFEDVHAKIKQMNEEARAKRQAKLTSLSSLYDRNRQSKMELTEKQSELQSAEQIRVDAATKADAFQTTAAHAKSQADEAQHQLSLRSSEAAEAIRLQQESETAFNTAEQERLLTQEQLTSSQSDLSHAIITRDDALALKSQKEQDANAARAGQSAAVAAAKGLNTRILALQAERDRLASQGLDSLDSDFDVDEDGSMELQDLSDPELDKVETELFNVQQEFKKKMQAATEAKYANMQAAKALKEASQNLSNAEKVAADLDAKVKEIEGQLQQKGANSAELQKQLDDAKAKAAAADEALKAQQEAHDQAIENQKKTQAASIAAQTALSVAEKARASAQKTVDDIKARRKATQENITNIQRDLSATKGYRKQLSRLASLADKTADLSSKQNRIAAAYESLALSEFSEAQRQEIDILNALISRIDAIVPQLDATKDRRFVDILSDMKELFARKRSSDMAMRDECEILVKKAAGFVKGTAAGADILKAKAMSSFANMQGAK